MDPKTTDPVIIDLIKWLKENLPDDVNEEDIFKKVRRVQKVFDTLISLSFEEFYNYALNQHREKKSQDEEVASIDDNNQRHPSHEPDVDGDEEDNESNDNNERENPSNSSTSSAKHRPQERSNNILTLEDIVNSKLNEMKEYISLNEEKQLKTKKLDASTAKLDLKREHYKLITSIRLDGCRDLISRYNRLMSKK